MSVIIKGLDMPNTCGQCNLRALDAWEDEYCVVLCSDIEDHTKRLYSCPLVEIPKGHGRVGDLDLLKDTIKDSIPAYGIGVKIPTYGDMDIMDKIGFIPTILEVEE